MRKALIAGAVVACSFLAVSSIEAADDLPVIDFAEFPDTVPAHFTDIGGDAFWCADRASMAGAGLEVSATLTCEPVVFVSVDYPDGVIVAIDAPKLNP